MDKLVGQVFETKDYDKFKSIKGNRKIDMNHVAKLRKSMVEHGFLNIPIIVNENMEIIDGQHRFTSAKGLELSFMYIINNGYSKKHMVALNIDSKTWKLDDYLHHFSSEGLEDYNYLAETKNNFPVKSLNILFHAIARLNLCEIRNVDGEIVENVNSSGVKRSFLDGTLNIKDRMKLENFLLSFLDMHNFVGRNRVNQLFMAFLELYTSNFTDSYSHMQMVNKLDRLGNALAEGTSKDHFIDILCNSIYSFGERIADKKILFNKSTNQFYRV